MSWSDQFKNKLDDIPESWDGITLEQKVQTLLGVIQSEMERVRKGTFDPSDGERAAALVLECQLALSDFYSDVEANSRNAKHNVELIESEVSNKLSSDATLQGKKMSEAALKRNALASQEVKEAKDTLVTRERDYKKWRCVYELLREAHILFRNISKL